MEAIDRPLTAPAPILVMVHVHYPEIWAEIAARLAERVDVPFHLLVTTSNPDTVLDRPGGRFLRDMNVLPVENRGRDILPFLRALAIASEFDIGLKLHTKKSPQRIDGGAWRTQLYDMLLPPSGGVSALVEAMRAEHRVGLVAPDGFSLSVRPWIFVNAAPMAAVMKALGYQLVDADLDDAFFAAGSMFWFRREALTALADPALPPLFEPEEGQLDGTIAHGLERLFAVEVRRQGFISTSVTALAACTPRQTSAELLATARAHADVPNIYFPAPGISAGAPAALPPTQPLFRRNLNRLRSFLQMKLNRQ